MMKRAQKPSMKVMGIECRTVNKPGRAEKDIPNLWDQFIAKGVFEKIPNKASDEVIALYCDYEGDHTQPYSCVIGCVVESLDEIPEGMVGKNVPSSTFAVFSPQGEFPQSILSSWQEIWQSNLKRSYVGDYELYPKGFSPKEPKGLEIFVAIE